MSDNTVRDDDSSSPDPLGILGWVIGGKYKIDTYISGGGFGEVYAGFNQHLTEQRVVVKFFKRVQSREKFDKEARILCQLDHPNINRVIDYLPDEGAAIVAFIDGIDGSQHLKTKGALPESLYLNVAKSMTKAIAYAHGKKIAHRDLKPGNILIDKNEHIFLIDFGIAKEIGGDATKTAYTALTPMFAAPERQAGDKDYNPFISDIYEMGITLFNFATNSLPYRNPVNPNFGEWGGQEAEKLSPELRRVLLKATHPDPEKRYNSASDMADDFDKVNRAFKSKSTFPTKTVIVAILIMALGFSGWHFRDELNRQYQQLSEKYLQSEKQASVPDTIQENEQETAILDTVRADTSNVSAIVDSTTTPKTETVPVTRNEVKKPVDPPKDVQKEESRKKTPKKAVTEPQPKKEDPPPPPVLEDSEILIMVTPFENATLLVNNRPWALGSSKVLPQGTYNIQVTHPDYPILKKKIRARKKNENINIDLGQEFRDLNLIDMQIALAPHSDNYFLEISFNGAKNTISRFPAMDLRKGEGTWDVVLNLKTLGNASESSVKIDSCVTFPYGGGPHSIVKGNEGTLKLGSNTPGEINSIPMVVFWSEK